MRLYAEDPRTFLPQAGRLERLRLPTGIRVDAGVEEGDEVGTSYDPLIAKLIAHGSTREEALDRLAAALAETEVGGVVTNLPFLRWLVAHPALRAGETTTAFLTEHPPLSAPPLRLPDRPWRGGFRLNLPGRRRLLRRTRTLPSSTARRSRARSARRCPARCSRCSSPRATASSRASRSSCSRR